MSECMIFYGPRVPEINQTILTILLVLIPICGYNHNVISKWSSWWTQSRATCCVYS